MKGKNLVEMTQAVELTGSENIMIDDEIAIIFSLICVMCF